MQEGLINYYNKTKEVWDRLNIDYNEELFRKTIPAVIEFFNNHDLMCSKPFFYEEENIYVVSLSLFNSIETCGSIYINPNGLDLFITKEQTESYCLNDFISCIGDKMDGYTSYLSSEGETVKVAFNEKGILVKGGTIPFVSKENENKVKEIFNINTILTLENRNISLDKVKKINI